MNCLASTWILVWTCITLAACNPLHMIQKRATLLETVGDLTAEEAGIINAGGEYTVVNSILHNLAK